MSLRSIGREIWVVERPFRFMGADFGNRMTVIRLADGGLLLHSPVELTAELKEQISSLGRVAYLVEPNAFHDLFVAGWRVAFPEAIHYAAHSRDGSLPLAGLDAAVIAEQIDVHQVQGAPKVNEFVFFHPISRTLILTDLVFNIAANVSWWSKVFFTLNDSYRKFGPSRLMRSMIANHAQFQRSLDTIYQWDFDQIVMSHGQILERGGKDALKKAFGFLLKKSLT
ncbi:MAG: DUF4336 domain-containing protein [Gammaproteobacteria bacterium]|nr:DUF4336 domain-containing protein [Gammaproteobacteria bacterium]